MNFSWLNIPCIQKPYNRTQFTVSELRHYLKHFKPISNSGNVDLKITTMGDEALASMIGSVRLCWQFR